MSGNYLYFAKCVDIARMSGRVGPLRHVTAHLGTEIAQIAPLRGDRMNGMEKEKDAAS